VTHLPGNGYKGNTGQRCAYHTVGYQVPGGLFVSGKESPVVCCSGCQVPDDHQQDKINSNNSKNYCRSHINCLLPCERTCFDCRICPQRLYLSYVICSLAPTAFLKQGPCRPRVRWNVASFRFDTYSTIPI